MIKTSFLFLIAFCHASSLYTAQVAAPKTNMSDIAHKLPYPLWTLILEYHGQTSLLSIEGCPIRPHITFNRIRLSSVDCLDRRLALKFFVITDSRNHKGYWGETRVSLETFRNPQYPWERTHTSPKKTTHRWQLFSDDRFKVEVIEGKKFILTDHAAIDPNYDILYKLLVANQKSEPAVSQPPAPSLLERVKDCTIQ